MILIPNQYLFVIFTYTFISLYNIVKYSFSVSNYRSLQDASRPLHTKCWSHPEGQILVQLCICLER